MRVITSKIRTRSEWANPFYGIPDKDRLELAEAIDLTDNHTLVDLGNGFIRLEPIDETKKIKSETMTEAKRILGKALSEVDDEKARWILLDAFRYLVKWDK